VSEVLVGVAKHQAFMGANLAWLASQGIG